MPIRDDRGYDEPTPWAPGVLVAVLTAIFAACVLIGLYDVVSGTMIILGVGAVLVVCAGVAPTAWNWRRRTGLRWLSWGAMAGQAIAVPVVVVLAIAGVG